MFNIELTKEDYGYYLSASAGFDVHNYVSFIEREAPEYGIKAGLGEGITELDGYRVKIVQFYEYSFERDNAFLENLRFSPGSFRGASSNEQQIAILVTGGFHTESMLELLNKNDISYISIIPNFRNSPGYESPYFNILSGGVSPFEKALDAAVSSIQVASLMNALGREANNPEWAERFRMAVIALSSMEGAEVPRVIGVKPGTGKENGALYDKGGYIIFSIKDGQPGVRVLGMDEFNRLSREERGSLVSDGTVVARDVDLEKLNWALSEVGQDWIIREGFESGAIKILSEANNEVFGIVEEKMNGLGGNGRLLAETLQTLKDESKIYVVRGLPAGHAGGQGIYLAERDKNGRSLSSEALASMLIHELTASIYAGNAAKGLDSHDLAGAVENALKKGDIAIAGEYLDGAERYTVIENEREVPVTIQDTRLSAEQRTVLKGRDHAMRPVARLAEKETGLFSAIRALGISGEEAEAIINVARNRYASSRDIEKYMKAINEFAKEAGRAGVVSRAAQFETILARSHNPAALMGLARVVNVLSRENVGGRDVIAELNPGEKEPIRRILWLFVERELTRELFSAIGTNISDTFHTFRSQWTSAQDRMAVFEDLVSVYNSGKNFVVTRGKNEEQFQGEPMNTDVGFQADIDIPLKFIDNYLAEIRKTGQLWELKYAFSDDQNPALERVEEFVSIVTASTEGFELLTDEGGTESLFKPKPVPQKNGRRVWLRVDREGKLQFSGNAEAPDDEWRDYRIPGRGNLFVLETEKFYNVFGMPLWERSDDYIHRIERIQDGKKESVIVSALFGYETMAGAKADSIVLNRDKIKGTAKKWVEIVRSINAIQKGDTAAKRPEAKPQKRLYAILGLSEGSSLNDIESRVKMIRANMHSDSYYRFRSEKLNAYLNDKFNTAKEVGNIFSEQKKAYDASESDESFFRERLLEKGMSGKVLDDELKKELQKYDPSTFDIPWFGRNIAGILLDKDTGEMLTGGFVDRRETYMRDVTKAEREKGPKREKIEDYTVVLSHARMEGKVELSPTGQKRVATEEDLVDWTDGLIRFVDNTGLDEAEKEYLRFLVREGVKRIFAELVIIRGNAGVEIYSDLGGRLYLTSDMDARMFTRKDETVRLRHANIIHVLMKAAPVISINSGIKMAGDVERIHKTLGVHFGSAGILGASVGLTDIYLKRLKEDMITENAIGILYGNTRNGDEFINGLEGMGIKMSAGEKGLIEYNFTKAKNSSRGPGERTLVGLIRGLDAEIVPDEKNPMDILAYASSTMINEKFPVSGVAYTDIAFYGREPAPTEEPLFADFFDYEGSGKEAYENVARLRPGFIGNYGAIGGRYDVKDTGEELVVTRLKTGETERVALARDVNVRVDEVKSMLDSYVAGIREGGLHTLTGGELRGMSELIKMPDKVNGVKALEGHKDILGYFDIESGTLYLNRGLVAEPIGLIHELGEGYIAVPEGYEGLSKHTYMRGVGGDVRIVFETLAGIIGVDKLNGMTDKELIAALKDKMREEGMREMTGSEGTLIKYNYDTRGEREKKVKIGAKELLYGLQDHMDPAGNADFTKQAGGIVNSLRRNVLNIVIIPSANISTRSKQAGLSGKVRRKFRGKGIDTRVMPYGDTAQLEAQIRSAIETADKNVKFYPKIYVYAMTEEDLDLADRIREEERPELIVIGNDVVKGADVSGSQVEVAKVIAVANMLLNDKRLKEDFGLSTEEMAEDRREKLIFFRDAKFFEGISEGTNFEHMNESALNDFMNKLLNGVIPMRITRINWEEIQDWHDAQEQVLMSL
ncbi:MAG: hypothetical protein ABIA77_02595, partial [Candidatus Omnitrophota bacterium]